MKLTHNQSIKLFVVLVCSLIFFLSSSSFAQRSDTPPKFSVGIMAEAGQGKMGNGVDVQDRNMIYTPISLFAGFNIKKFRLGVNYEYNIVGQSVDPAEVSGQNISGKGSAPGVRLEYYDGKQAFGLIYRLADAFTLDKPTVQGTTAIYKSKGGFQVQYYRQIKKRIGFVIDYTSETFDESLTNNIKWNRIGVGVVFTNFANSK